MTGSGDFPKLRPLEFRASTRIPRGCDLLDPSGLSTHVLSVSGPLAVVLSRMDGHRSRADIQAEFMRRFGRMLYSDDLERLIGQFDEVGFLEGPSFDRHVAELTRQYREGPVRKLNDESSLGAPIGELGPFLNALLDAPRQRESTSDARILGIVAPHLDYPRGGPCYSSAYGDLARRSDATRFVILGTNHFGLSSTIVGTRKDFATPFGTVPCDRDLLARLEGRCGADLCEGEFDHAREHSVELQVVLLKHVLGDRSFEIVPFLCPDPCADAREGNGNGRENHLRRFAEALREALDDDPSICLIAGADLSHVGRYFQDERDLDAESLARVESSDRGALSRIEASEPDSFLACVSGTANATHICSVGCIFTLSTALLGRAQPKLLRYHQAVTAEVENCVTCAAMEFAECS